MAAAALLLAVAPPVAGGAAARGPGASAPAAATLPDATVRRWGEAGHRMIGEVAARALPPEMPAFFRDAVAQLGYLNPEPDRWRAPRGQALDGAMDGAYAPEHYVDMELLPPHALDAPDRFAYADSLHAAGASAATVGLLPFRIYELTARLREEFRLWRAAPNAQVRQWVEARIVDDAGILGHYVADAANPHHETIHHHGWVGENPKGYSTDRTIHGRFESAYVQTHIRPDDFAALVAPRPRTLLPLRDSVRAYLDQSYAQLDRLYELEKQEPFGPDTRGPEHRRFVAERLAAGATALRDVWWTAWVTSADSAGTGKR
jgi:hypothetical protein